jgi:BlaI family penicillinase repressor
VTGKKRPEKRSVKLTEAEWAIMRVVWQHRPCAAGTVQEALAATKSWAYSTVKTTMDRMVRKGLLRTRQIRNLQAPQKNLLLLDGFSLLIASLR